jgi:transposase-like protein
MESKEIAMNALTDPIFTDENKARERLEALRWPNGPICPHCGVVGGHYAIEAKTPAKPTIDKDGKSQRHTVARPGLYKCKDCRSQFSVTVGTVFERSKVPLTKWLAAVYLIASSKKGISSHQIHRTLGVTYKTAWFMTHRIREAMRDTHDGKLGGFGTKGIVEADETYYGKTREGKGERLAKKQKIVALVERKGRVRAFHVPVVTAATVGPILATHIDKNARLMTDGAMLYSNLGKGFASHETVNHAAGEYARGDVTTNSVEGFFGVLKRGLRGVYQCVSPNHLSRYVDEFAFRFNHRVALNINDVERAQLILEGIGGKRLTYRRPHHH